MIRHPNQQEGEKDDEEANKSVIPIKQCHYDGDRTDEKIVQHVRTGAPYDQSPYLRERLPFTERNGKGHCTLINREENEPEREELPALNSKILRAFQD